MYTALSLAFVYVAASAAYVAWAWHEVAAGASTAWFVVGAIAIFFGAPALVTALWFAIAWVWRTPRPPDKQIGFGPSVWLYLNETRSIMRNGPRMAFAWWTLADPPPAPAAAPVLLLHGVLCNGAMWLDWTRRLPARGLGPIYALSYGPPLLPIEAFADQVASKIDAILAETGARQVTLVGHSMGGLVARAYLRRHGGAKVRKLVTIGTPHHGSVHAWLFPGACLAQMRPGSAWLDQLDRGEDSVPRVPIVSLWSWHDSMVAPQKSSWLASANNVELIGIGHNALLADVGVFERVAAELERAAAEAKAAGQPAPGVEPARSVA
jgi:pimeloyl-ACP methyl ester carboxylesterase